MKIQSLSLENFRGIQSQFITFGGKKIDIYGANGLGKTTIANAICWLLVDRPATEEKEFDPKTIGAKGLHHIAEMRIKLESGEEMTLKKDFYEKYTKKKGAAVAEYTGNVTDYYIDGVKSKQKDYNATIERILGLPLDKAKMLLVLSFFTDSMKTDEKRKILFELADEFTDADVFNANKELLELTKFLKIPGNDEKLYTIEQWKSIASEERRKLNKELELIPARIDEAKKAIPENLPDEKGLKSELKKLEQDKENLLEQKRQLEADDENKAAESVLKLEIAEKRTAYIEKTAKIKEEKNDKIAAFSTELQNISNAIREVDGKITEIEGKIKSFTNKRNNLITEYSAIKQKVWDEGAEICPTCGQKLPAERIEELRAEFNRKKSERLAEINKEGQACSQTAIKAEEEELKAAKEDFQKLNAKHIEVYKAREAIEKEVKAIPSFEDTEEYADIQRRMQELLESPKGSDTEAIDNQLEEIQGKMESVNASIAEAAAAKKSQKRIEELEGEIEATTGRLDYLDRGIYLCEEFTRKKAHMVTESINKHFSITRFILFRDQINGGLKEVCEPTGQNSFGEWVEYRSLNFAAKVNTQLDIIDTLNKHYGVNLPVIMDQGESVTKPIEINEQFIRLIVDSMATNFRIEQM